MRAAVAERGTKSRSRPLAVVAHLAKRIFRREFALLGVAAITFAYFAAFAPSFTSTANLYDMARVSTFLLIVAVPLTLVFISGEIDLSVGSLFGLSAVIFGESVVDAGMDPWIAALLTVGVGALVGLINGAITTLLRVPSFIVTLGMLSLLRGVALVITSGLPISFPRELESSFFTVANGRIGNFPSVILWGLGIAILGIIALRYSVFGAHVYAVGGNAGAARRLGIKSVRVKTATFVLTGAAVGLAAALQGAWLRTGNPTTGNGFELQAIAAIIIGGAALTGGAGNMMGTLTGVAIIGMIPNGLVLAGIQANWNLLLIGLIIVIVGALEAAIKREGVLADVQRALHR